ncbi:hypothetical protein JCM9140_3676 [Halalkalibacter wakoensis JCM 9140]|uniref:Protein kinase domain-containing protein n=1 Tax=Halalkalibacter wakoensis JCM 9140 TaxID=1236970 RepID=W4Q834_9BACI|nr:protein kinase [Halalkalibacter wakoensis]GAE27524.1 hypothetical protein JCM9140_3676 [Halalkalibacter wakoensis JCM 9140]
MQLGEEKNPNFLIDEKNYKHHIVAKLGEGGQGAVYSTRDENVVIKVVIDEETQEIIQNEEMYEQFKQTIDEVRILNLPEDLPIAKPIHMLKKPYNGYIMRLLSNMVPIKTLINGPKTGLSQFYIDTGGLKHRLEILQKAARILARVHSLPVVYADISPENIFISADKDATEVWFIDADNMRYTIDFKKAIFTPGYGAPEIVKSTCSNNTLSDVYSFALLAFEVLALQAPFEGELVVNGGGWDTGEAEDSWDEDTEVEEQDDWDKTPPDDQQPATNDYYEKAARGEIPWIEDENDNRNFTKKGIPRNIILSPAIRALFQRTFGAEGRSNPASRPTMKQWYDVLQQAVDATVTCKKCTSTFYIGHNTCPFCNEGRDPVFYGQIYDRYFVKEIVDKINNTDPGLKIFPEAKLEEESITDEVLYSKVGFKAFDQTPGVNYFYNVHTDDIFLQDDVTPMIELKQSSIISIKNLSDRVIEIEDKYEQRTLYKNEIYDCRTLEDVKLQIPLGELKTRNISFRVI